MTNSNTSSIDDLKKKVVALETTYNTINDKLNQSSVEVHNDEIALLACLVQMVPLLKSGDKSDELDELDHNQYELNASLTLSRGVEQKNKSNLLGCLQNLMPIQNAYLGGIIKSLQDQLVNKTNEYNTAVAATSSSKWVEDDDNQQPRPRAKRRPSNLEKLSE
jgi:hypothetical protein